MDFTLDQFANSLKEWFTNSALFPEYADDGFLAGVYKQTDEEKHGNRQPLHLKEAATNCLRETTTTTDNMVTFDYGNEKMEETHPYYHILQQAPYIRKRNQATNFSRGSEYRKNNATKDYEKVSWNGKTFTKEYSKNVRGQRDRIKNASHWAVVDGKPRYENADSKVYRNVHYQYIDNILDSDVAYRLASEYGLKYAGKSNTGFGEEYGLQIESTYTTDIIGILESFM